LFEREERKRKHTWGREEQRLVVSTQRKRRTVPHPPGTTAVFPFHRHSSTAIPSPSALPTPAEPEREKRNRTEQKGKKKQRPRALHRGGGEKTAAPPPGIIVISPPSRCPDHLPPLLDHKQGRTEQTRGRGRDSRRQREEEKNCNSSIAAWNNARPPPQAAVSSVTRALPFQVTLFSVFSSSWLVSCMQSVYCSRFCSKRNN